MTKKKAEDEENAAADSASNEDLDTENPGGGNGEEPPRPTALDGKSEVAKLREELEREREKSKDLHNQVLRAVADYDNYKKRLVRDQAREVEVAKESIIKKLLQVVDNFERAQQHSRTATKVETIRDGMEAIHQQFIGFLKEVGVTVMEADKTPFDPHNHEAIGQQPSADHPEGTVLHVAEHGYLFKDRVLRHAKVIVSHQPESAEDPDDPATAAEHKT